MTWNKMWETPERTAMAFGSVVSRADPSPSPRHRPCLSSVRGTHTCGFDTRLTEGGRGGIAMLAIGAVKR